MRLERTGSPSPLNYESVDVGEEVGGVGRVEVGGLSGVDVGATADGHERVKVSLTGELNGGVVYGEGCFEVGGRRKYSSAVNRPCVQERKSDAAFSFQRATSSGLSE